MTLVPELDVPPLGGHIPQFRRNRRSSPPFDRRHSGGKLIPVSRIEPIM